MSEWWRRNKRLEEAGEIAPSGRVPLSLVPELPEYTHDKQRSDLRQRIGEIDARLTLGNAENEYGRTPMKAAEWRRLKFRLVEQKTKAIAELDRLKIEMKTEAHMTTVPRETFFRCASLLLATRTILAGFDELAPEEREVLTAASDFLKRGGFLP